MCTFLSKSFNGNMMNRRRKGMVGGPSFPVWDAAPRPHLGRMLTQLVWHVHPAAPPSSFKCERPHSKFRLPPCSSGATGLSPTAIRLVISTIHIEGGVRTASWAAIAPHVRSPVAAAAGDHPSRRHCPTHQAPGSIRGIHLCGRAVWWATAPARGHESRDGGRPHEDAGAAPPSQAH